MFLGTNVDDDSSHAIGSAVLATCGIGQRTQGSFSSHQLSFQPTITIKGGSRRAEKSCNELMINDHEGCQREREREREKYYANVEVKTSFLQ